MTGEICEWTGKGQTRGPGVCMAKAMWYVTPQVTGGPYPDSHDAPHLYACSRHLGWACMQHKGNSIVHKRNRS